MAVSLYTLPIAMVLGVVLWTLRLWGVADGWHLLGVALAALCAYGVMELNNRYMLIRVRTRLASSLYWVGVAALLPIDAVMARSLGASLCMALALALMFSTYGKRDRVIEMFHAYVLIGVGALLCPHLVVCAPLGWLYLIIYMRAMTARVFCASLLGIALVAMVYGALVLSDVAAPFALSWGIDRWQMPSMGAWVMMAVGAVGVLSYLHRNYDDKIQVRMMLYVLALQWVVLQALSVLYGDASLLPTVWLSAALLVAHLFATSRSRLTSVWLLFIVLATLSTFFD